MWKIAPLSVAASSFLWGISPLLATPLANNPQLTTASIEGFNVGEKVEILRDNQWRSGEILAVQSSGQASTYQVRYLDVGFLENGVSASRLRKVAHRPKVGKVRFEMGTPVIVAEGTNYREGVITGYVLGTGNGDRYEVSYEDFSTDANVKPHQLKGIDEAAALGIKTTESFK